MAWLKRGVLNKFINGFQIIICGQGAPVEPDLRVMQETNKNEGFVFGAKNKKEAESLQYVVMNGIKTLSHLANIVLWTDLELPLALRSNNMIFCYLEI